MNTNKTIVSRYVVGKVLILTSYLVLAQSNLFSREIYSPETFDGTVQALNCEAVVDGNTLRITVPAAPKGWSTVSFTLPGNIDLTPFNSIEVNGRAGLPGVTARVFLDIENDGKWQAFPAAVSSSLLPSQSGSTDVMTLPLGDTIRLHTTAIRLTWNREEWDTQDPSNVGNEVTFEISAIDAGVTQEEPPNASGAATIPYSPEQLSAISSLPKSNAPFKLSVYMNGNSHPPNLQIGRVMAQLAHAGVDEIAMIIYQYQQYQPQGLTSLAADWGITLNLGLSWPPIKNSPDPSIIKQSISELVAYVNATDKKRVVRAWYVADEIESGYAPSKDYDTVAFLENQVSLYKSLDPTRTTIVNHTDHAEQWEGRMLNVGEDESWCSVFWANSMAEERLQKLLKKTRATYGNDRRLVAVFGAQGTSKAITTDENRIFQGLTGGTLAEIASRPTSLDIQDYIVTAFGLGFAGAALFAYDAYYDYTWYSIVDERGRSREGRLEAMRSAMVAIRKAQGAPSLTLEVTPRDEGSLNVSVTIQEGSAPVSALVVQVSADGGYNWTDIEGMPLTGGSLAYTPKSGWQRLGWLMIRAKCKAGSDESLWSVWNVFPWRKPNIS